MHCFSSNGLHPQFPDRIGSAKAVRRHVDPKVQSYDGCKRHKLDCQNVEVKRL